MDVLPHLALGKVRGLITAVGYLGKVREDVKTPVFLALNESFDPDPSRMLTQEQANRMETYARLYSDRTKSGTGTCCCLTATFSAVETTTDPRWPSDEDVLRPKTPVFLALNESFDPDPSRMLTQEQANRMETYARLYSDRTKSGNRRRPRPK